MLDQDPSRHSRFGRAYALEELPREIPARDLQEEPVLDIDQIQGNILAGFNKPYQSFIFLKIGDLSSARKWLHEITKKVATLEEVLAFNRLFKQVSKRRQVRDGTVRASWLNVALTFTGLEQLLGDHAIALAGEAFQEGMWKRSAILGDPQDPSVRGHASNWVVGAPGNMPDLVVILADDVQNDLRKNAVELIRDLPTGLRLIRMEEGEVLPDGREHFGFRDGISQPDVRGRLSSQPGDFLTPRTAEHTKLVWPGEFIFGYPRHDPASPSGHGPVATGGAAWAKNGSFLVYRRLVQDVPLFQTLMRKAVEELRRKSPDFADWTPEKLGARLIGRWPNGAPLARSPEADTTELSRENEFGYLVEPELLGAESQPERPRALPDFGFRCPFSAHIRKANPRDDVRIGGYEISLGHRLMRRGVTFNYPGEQGLHFLCYQTSIERQFEFIVKEWVNNPDYPEQGSGVDPIIGNLSQGAKIFRFRILQEKGTLAEVDLEIPGGLVTPTGGCYFFAPSISALESMAG